jgi:hypothetical protein
MANSTIASQQAQQRLLDTQTQGAQIANQKSALQLGLLKNFLQGDAANASSTGAPSSQGQPSSIGNTGVTPDVISQQAFSQYAPIPAARPPSVVQRIYNANVAGMPEVGAAIGAQYDAQVAGENQRRMLGASASYQSADQVANAPEGAAWETLNRTQPDVAAKLKQQYANDTPDQLDADVRAFAQHIGAATHQYSGRDTGMENGVLVDKPSGKQVLGTDQLLTGLSAADKEKAFASANEIVTIGAGLPTARWKAEGFASPEAYVVHADRAARSTASAPQQTQPTQTPSPKQQAPTQSELVSSAVPKAVDPQLKSALADTDYRLAPIAKPNDQVSLENAKNQTKLNTDNSNELKKNSDEVAAASARALQNFQAAKTILDAPDGKRVTGLPGQISQELARLGLDTDTADHRVEAVKYLTNGALGGLKTTYGSKPAMFDVKVNLEQAFPDVKSQGIGAVRDLVDANIAASKYDLASSQRVLPYLKAGNDATNFNKWNEQYFQRSGAVNTQPVLRPGQQNSGAKAMPSGDKLQTYANTHFGGDSAKAKAFLKTQGYN